MTVLLRNLKIKIKLFNVNLEDTVNKICKQNNKNIKK